MGSLFPFPVAGSSNQHRPSAFASNASNLRDFASEDVPTKKIPQRDKGFFYHLNLINLSDISPQSCSTGEVEFHCANHKVTFQSSKVEFHCANHKVTFQSSTEKKKKSAYLASKMKILPLL